MNRDVGAVCKCFFLLVFSEYALMDHKLFIVWGPFPGTDSSDILP